jgi:hypothetical protein
MLEFPIPHADPVRFAKSLNFADKTDASVNVEFNNIPTLAMLVEAAAQSSAGVLTDEKTIQKGFLVTLKNVLLLEKPKLKTYIIAVHLEHKIENFKSFSFQAFENKKIIATGILSVSIMP